MVLRGTSFWGPPLCIPFLREYQLQKPGGREGTAKLSQKTRRAHFPPLRITEQKNSVLEQSNIEGVPGEKRCFFSPFSGSQRNQAVLPVRLTDSNREVLEHASLHPTTVDTVHRHGGSTSPTSPWPEEARVSVRTPKTENRKPDGRGGAKVSWAACLCVEEKPFLMGDVYFYSWGELQGKLWSHVGIPEKGRAGEDFQAMGVVQGWRSPLVCFRGKFDCGGHILYLLESGKAAYPSGKPKRLPPKLSPCSTVTWPWLQKVVPKWHLGKWNQRRENRATPARFGAIPTWRRLCWPSQLQVEAPGSPRESHHSPRRRRRTASNAWSGCCWGSARARRAAQPGSFCFFFRDEWFSNKVDQQTYVWALDPFFLFFRDEWFAQKVDQQTSIWALASIRLGFAWFLVLFLLYFSLGFYVPFVLCLVCFSWIPWKTQTPNVKKQILTALCFPMFQAFDLFSTRVSRLASKGSATGTSTGNAAPNH